MSKPRSSDEMFMAALTFNPDAFTDLVELEESGSTGLIADLIGDYLINSRDLSVAIADSARRGDLPLLERSAHSLKSSSKIMGLDALAEVAYRIEDGARRGRVHLDDVALAGLYLEPALAELARFREARRVA